MIPVFYKVTHQVSTCALRFLAWDEKIFFYPTIASGNSAYEIGQRTAGDRCQGMDDTCCAGDRRPERPRLLLRDARRNEIKPICGSGEDALVGLIIYKSLTILKKRTNFGLDK